MAARLRFDVTAEWLMQFKDIERLRFLNRSISCKRRFPEDVDWYVGFITKFYHCDQFNGIYDKWIYKPAGYKRPSLDHMTPLCKGGENKISNLQFVTWFENRCKNDMTMYQWNHVKANVYKYLV